MTDTPAETAETPPAEVPDGGSQADRLDKVESTLQQVLDFLKGGGPAQPVQAEPVPDIKAEVREAVRTVQREDKSKADKVAAAQSIEDRLGSLEHKTEIKPVEYNAHTRAIWQPDR